MMASTVSSKILKAMAKQEGFHFLETLTGFKWMGNKALELLAQGKHVLFAYEEAIGFMVSPTVLDKDGVSAGGNIPIAYAYAYRFIDYNPILYLNPIFQVKISNNLLYLSSNSSLGYIDSLFTCKQSNTCRTIE